MNKKHPYLTYGLALVMVENELIKPEEVTLNHISNEILKGLHTFRLCPIESIEGKKKVRFDYAYIEKGEKGTIAHLSPNIIASFKQAGNIWKGAHKLLSDSEKKQDKEKPEEFTMSFAPISGEFLSFSIQGGIGRGKPKSTLFDLLLSATTTLTDNKPCLQFRIEKKGMPELDNSTIIPDLPLEQMIDFIKLFKYIKAHKLSNDLFYADVVRTETGKKENIKVTYTPRKPQIFKGNFPNPPRSSSLGSIALLGTIGDFMKEYEVSERAKRVLDSLKDRTIYQIKYGNAKTFTFNNHVIDLAKEGNLRTIVDSLYYTVLFNQGKRRSENITEYQKFDLMASRFLQLFNNPTFKDFLALRAEYPNEISQLLNLYFIKMEKIDPEIVQSARILGKWLNSVAYFTAKREIKEGTANYWEKLREQKAKVLVELESSTFSAKSGDALIAQVVTRAGRLSGMDAPEKADLFMEKAMSGELPIDQARNLLIAFSRLKNAFEAKNSNEKVEDADELNEQIIPSEYSE